MSSARLRYGQCWEDAEVLVRALEPAPGALILSVASGGENSLALLSRPGVRVLAIDRSPAQIAALELKVAAFRHLSHGDMLQLLGAWPATRDQRQRLYQRCREDLCTTSQAFWDGDPRWLGCGLLPAARFERYLALFRRLVLPLVHGHGPRREALLARSPEQQQRWYDARWDGWRWRALFRLFFSRGSLAALGTDAASVRYGEASQAAALLEQVRRVMVEGDPSRNPYLHWLLQGRYGAVLPLALRPGMFAPIRARLDQLQWRRQSLQDWLQESQEQRVAGFNLSNVLEYVDAEAAGTLLEALHRRAVPGARLLLWNRLAERDTGLAASGRWRSLDGLAERLHRASQVPFYRRLVVAEALAAADTRRAPAPGRQADPPHCPGSGNDTGQTESDRDGPGSDLPDRLPHHGLPAAGERSHSTPARRAVDPAVAGVVPSAPAPHSRAGVGRSDAGGPEDDHRRAGLTQGRPLP